MLWNLGDFHPSLKEIYLIQGVGLCSNIYVINWGNLTIIDSGNGSSWNSIKPKMEDLGLPIKNVSQVIITHTHFDHTGGLKEIFLHAHPKIFVHEFELKNLDVKPSLIIAVRDGDEIPLNNKKLKVVHTPGHTVGSICLYEIKEGILFSGDTIFPNGSFGRTDLPTGDEKALINSLKRLSKMNVNFLLPGHEFPVLKNAKKHVEASLKAALSFFSG